MKLFYIAALCTLCLTLGFDNHNRVLYNGADDDTTDVDPQYIYYWRIFFTMITVNAVLNALCTIISLALMIKLELHKRVFMSMVVLMTFFQLLYDLTLIPCDNINEISCCYWRATQLGVGYFSGIASNAVTNQISVVVCYILVTKKPLRIDPWFTAIHTLVPSLALGVPAFIGYLQVQTVLDDDGRSDHYFFIVLYIYIIVRAVQVMINFIATFIIILMLAELDLAKMNLNVCECSILKPRKRNASGDTTITSDLKERMTTNPSDSGTTSDITSTDKVGTDVLTSTNSISESTSSPFSIRTWCQSMVSCLYQFFTCSYFYEFSTKIKRRNYPMFALAGRLIGYPIVQSLSRFGASWYELDQGTTTELYLKTIMSSEDRQLQTVELFVYCILVPIGGFGCFIIFLRIETDARNLLRRWLNCLFTCGYSTDDDKEKLVDDEDSRLSIRNQKSVRKSYYYNGDRYTFNTGSTITTNYKNEDYDSYEEDYDSDDSIDRERYSFQAESSRYTSQGDDDRSSYTYGNAMAIMNSRPSVYSVRDRQHNPINSDVLRGKESPYSTKERGKYNDTSTKGDSTSTSSRDRHKGLRKASRPKSTKVVVNLDALMGEDEVSSSDGNHLKDIYTHMTDEEILDLIVLQGKGKEAESTNSAKKKESRKGRSGRSKINKAEEIQKSLTVLKKFNNTSTSDNDRGSSRTISDDRNVSSMGGEDVEMTAVT